MLSRPRVLVADDNECIRTLLEHMLKLAPFDAVLCADGEEAWQAWLAAARNGERFSLVVLDYHMPRRDGLDVAESIRAHEAAAGLEPVLLGFMTGFFEELEENGASGLADIGILRKPADIMGLAERLKAVLEQTSGNTTRSAAPQAF